MKKVELVVEGMHCASCASNIDNALTPVHGVSSANVNLTTRKATIVYNEKVLKVEDLAKIIISKGFKVRKNGGGIDNNNNY